MYLRNVQANFYRVVIYSLFCQLSRLFLKRGGWKPLSFRLFTFPKKSLLLKIFLETVQKDDKIVDIHFFENVAFEKKLPVIKTFHLQNKWYMYLDAVISYKKQLIRNTSLIS